MYCRDCIAQEFYIEEHAVLYALFVKAARELYGPEGDAASVAGTVLYGRERGRRMARRALADGADLSPNSYLLYTEWSDHLGWGSSRVAAWQPEYVTQTLRCGWCSSWLRHGLLDYGKLYCQYIDRSIVEGFCPENRLLLTQTLADGGSCCEFYWIGAQLKTEEEQADFVRRKQELGDRAVRDFLYHTGHLCSAMRRAYRDKLGEQRAEPVIQGALEEFRQIFRPSKLEALLIESERDFSVVE